MYIHTYVYVYMYIYIYMYVNLYNCVNIFWHVYKYVYIIRSSPQANVIFISIYDIILLWSNSLLPNMSHLYLICPSPAMIFQRDLSLPRRNAPYIHILSNPKKDVTIFCHYISLRCNFHPFGEISLLRSWQYFGYEVSMGMGIEWEVYSS